MTHLKEGRTTLLDRRINCACVVVVLFRYRAAAKGVVFRIHATFCISSVQLCTGGLIPANAAISIFPVAAIRTTFAMQKVA